MVRWFKRIVAKAYLVGGDASVDGHALKEFELAVLQPGRDMTLASKGGSFEAVRYWASYPSVAVTLVLFLAAATALCDSANCGASVVPMLAGAPIGSAPMAAGRGLAATPLL